MDWLHAIFQKSPESALFLSLAIGYAIGKLTFGKFQLGGVAGSLLAAVIISQVGVEIDNGVKAVMVAVFIYAVGYESGPQFFNSLNRNSLREIAMAVFMAVAGLVTVVVLAKLFHLDKGIAAGLAAGVMTQSAIIGTAGDLGNFTSVSGIRNLGPSVTLTAGDAVTQTQPIIAGSLELLGTGPYTLTNTANNVTTIAASGPTGVDYTDADDLTVGQVNTTVGMTVGGNIQLTTLAGGSEPILISRGALRSERKSR